MLRPYQQNTVNRFLELQGSSEKDLYILPTASGKSHIIAEMAKYLKGTTAIITPTRELAIQNKAKLSVDIPVMTVNKAHIDMLTVDNLIIDECHLVSKWGLMYASLIERAKKVIGLTATPFRLDCGHLVPSVFDRIAYEVKRDELLCDHYVSPRNFIKIEPEYIINVRNESFTSKTLLSEDVCPYTQRSLDHFLAHCSDTSKTLIFGCDLKHCKEIKKIIDAPIISGKTSKSERDTMIENFKSGSIPVLINCEILTTGFDYPALQNIVILRPTQSYSLYEQIIGRGDRLSEGKDHCNIYDYTINYFNFENVRNNKPSLRHCIHCHELTDYRDKNCQHCGKTLIKGEAPSKKCMHCQASNYPQASYCRECGKFIRRNVQVFFFDKVSTDRNVLVFKKGMFSSRRIPLKNGSAAKEIRNNLTQQGTLYYKKDFRSNKLVVMKIEM